MSKIGSKLKDDLFKFTQRASIAIIEIALCKRMAFKAHYFVSCWQTNIYRDRKPFYEISVTGV